ncbi:MAG: ParB/RepB/Spo0J family partition protein [Clostridia bacterium]|nr:ParB/RepB/Spo0J family partition protein [Clostridia bacterium]
MNGIEMIPIERLVHHPENPRLDLGDLTELTESIRANGIFQNLTVVFDPAHNMSPKEWSDLSDQYSRKPTEELRQLMDSKRIPDRYLVVIGNRRLEAAKAAGLTELPCVVSEMSHEEQIATMLQENMQRSDLTLYEQAKGIQMMIDLGFSKDQVSERTGFSKTTIERRLAVAALPDKETKEAVAYGYDLIDLAEIAKIEDRKTQKDLLKGTPDSGHGLDTSWLRQRIRNALHDQEQQRIVCRLLQEIRNFAKELKNPNDRWSNKYERVPGLTIKIEEGAKVKYPKDPDNYRYYISYGDIEFYLPAKKQKRVKTDAEIALEKKQHDAKELNDRMRDRRITFVSGYSPSRMQEAHLRAKMMEWVFGGVNKYSIGEFKCTYHSWSGTLFRKMAGIPLEEGRDKDESLLDELTRRNVPKGRAFLAWLLCGGLKADDRQGYANQYNGIYQHDEDLDDVYTILTEAGYVLSEEEQAWKDGTHEFYQEEKQR